MNKAFEHWDKIYTRKTHDKLSWHQDKASVSLDWILECTNIKSAIVGGAQVFRC